MSSKNGRPPDRRDRIVESLRQLIVSGKLGPGDRLPPHAILEQKHGAQSLTVRTAMDVLREEGFIESQHRRGTFVVPHPPHLSQYAVAFPWEEAHTPSQFYVAIGKEATRLQSPECRMFSFYRIEAGVDSPDLYRLFAWEKAQRLAGLILTHNLTATSPVSTEADRTGLPRVVVATGGEAGRFPSIYPDLEGFRQRAFAHLAATGRRNLAVAMLATSGRTPADNISQLTKQAARHGLTVKPHWVQAFHLEAAPWSNQAMQLLFHRSNPNRPDALLIDDDNFVPDITAGVAASGIKVPDELSIVTMTNFPWPLPAAVPVTRLGFDIRRLVASCMDLIAQERRGETPPPHTAIPAVFEGELGDG